MKRIGKENRKKRMMLCAAALTALLAGCGNSSKYENTVQSVAPTADAVAYDAAAVEEGAAYDAGYGVYENASYGTKAGNGDMADADTQLSDENVQTSDRKLIRTVDLYTETEQYDELLASLEGQIASLGGYVEYRYQYNGNRDVYVDPYAQPAAENTFQNRSSNLTIRIPSDRLDEFIGKVGEISNIVNKEERVEDVTLKYVDLESHKKALETEQERLMELMDRAETVEELITIESRLSDVRYELESMESQLRTLQNQVTYSTVTLNVQEVRRLTPVNDESIWGRIRQGLSDTFYDMGIGIENGFVGFVVHLPYIVLWLIVIVILFFVLRRIRRALRKRKEKKLAAKTADTAKNENALCSQETGDQPEADTEP